MSALADAWPEDGIAVVETPSSTAALRNRLRLSRPGSYYFSSSGGLGFGISAAVGVQLAEPSRPVVCVLGEGSAQYGITALWTAVAYRLPVTFLVLRNEEYMILKWFAEFEQATGLPGLDLPGLDVAASPAATACPRVEVDGRERADRSAARSDRRGGRAAARAGAGRQRHVARLTCRRERPRSGASHPSRQGIIRYRDPHRMRARLGRRGYAGAAGRSADGGARRGRRGHPRART